MDTVDTTGAVITAPGGGWTVDATNLGDGAIPGPKNGSGLAAVVPESRLLQPASDNMPAAATRPALRQRLGLGRSRLSGCLRILNCLVHRLD